jgi:transcriptional regulator with XRE-family HTH domain
MSEIEGFAKRLISLRKEHGLTQEAIGNELGVSKSAVSKFEKAVSYPLPENLVKLARMLKVTVDYLLTGEAPKKPSLEDTALNNSDVSGESKKIPVNRRILADDRRGEQPGFGYGEANPKQVLGNMVEQLDQNTSDIEELRAALLEIRQQLKS